MLEESVFSFKLSKSHEVADKLDDEEVFIKRELMGEFAVMEKRILFGNEQNARYAQPKCPQPDHSHQ